MRLAIGIVGCGTIAQKYVRQMNGYADLYFVSRSQRSADRLDNEMHGCGTMPSLEYLLATPAIKGVLIGTPAPVRESQAVQALASGRSVLLASPGCTNRAALSTLERLLAPPGAPFLLPGDHARHSSLCKRLISLLHVGRLGSPQHVQLRGQLVSMGAGWRKEHGALLTEGTALLSLCSDLLTEPADSTPIEVSAYLPGRNSGSAEQTFSLAVRYPSGRMATLDFLRPTQRGQTETKADCALICERGSVHFSLGGHFALIRRPHHPPSVLFSDWHDRYGHLALADCFVAALRRRKAASTTDFVRHKSALETVFRAYQTTMDEPMFRHTSRL